jgi:hypothetical protein
LLWVSLFFSFGKNVINLKSLKPIQKTFQILKEERNQNNPIDSNTYSVALGFSLFFFWKECYKFGIFKTNSKDFSDSKRREKRKQSNRFKYLF